jgi:m7GpppX diphosphatase
MTKVLRVLSENHDTKYIAIEGQIEEDEGEEKTIKSGILLLNKTPFEFDEVVTLMKDGEQQFKINFINDIYHEYTVAARSACNGVKLTFIYPATPLHIEKYSKKDFCLVTETRHRYETIVVPYMEKQKFGLQWVYNILDGISERERVLLDADDFILMPGPRWDGKVNDSMVLLAIVKSRNIRSIRDLKLEHLPLLQNILDKSTVGRSVHQ